MKLTLFLLAALTLTAARAQTPQPVLPLYSGSIPNSKPSNVQEASTQQGTDTRITGVVQPSLTVFMPDRAKATGTAVIICPGGGYGFLSMNNEGFTIAQKLTEMGVAAFILKYRLPNDQSQPDKSLAPLLDVQRAIQLVREVAPKYGLNPEKVGVMGFSAGGHLAALAATRFTQPAGSSPAPAAAVRPAFAVLVYPVISMRDSLNRGSNTRLNLLGPAPPAPQVQQFSAERLVSAQTPPVFIVAAQDDQTVPVQHSLLFYQACLRRGVPVEMHLYPRGGHGFGAVVPGIKDQWLDRLQNWLTSGGL